MEHTCVAIHRDEGISGKSMDNRPGLAAALDDVCRQRAVLVVQSLSLDAAAIARQLNSMGVACRSRMWRAQAVVKVLGRG